MAIDLEWQNERGVALARYSGPPLGLDFVAQATRRGRSTDATATSDLVRESREKRMRIYLAAIAFLAIIAIPRQSFACRCSPMSVADALSTSDVVFAGRVTSVRLPDPDAEGEAPTIVEFRVLRPWKNVRGTRVTLYTHRNLMSCEGYEFVVGERYLVFARKNGTEEARRYGVEKSVLTYGVSLCGGTTSFRNPGTAERQKQLEEFTH